MNENTPVTVHWRFWLVGVVALLWHVMGIINYLVQTNAEALSSYPDAARVLVESRPPWATGAFAIAVFGGGFGSFLLLFRKSAAYGLFIASLVGVLVTNLHTFRVAGSKEIWIGSVMSVVVAGLLIWYSRRAARQGIIG